MIEPYAQGKRWKIYGGSCLDVLAAGLLPAGGALIVAARRLAQAEADGVPTVLFAPAEPENEQVGLFGEKS